MMSNDKAGARWRINGPLAEQKRINVRWLIIIGALIATTAFSADDTESPQWGDAAWFAELKVSCLESEESGVKVSPTSLIYAGPFRDVGEAEQWGKAAVNTRKMLPPTITSIDFRGALAMVWSAPLEPRTLLPSELNVVCDKDQEDKRLDLPETE